MKSISQVINESKQDGSELLNSLENNDVKFNVNLFLKNGGQLKRQNIKVDDIYIGGMLLEITDLTQKGLEVGASYVFGDIDDEKEFKKLKGDLNNITKKGNEVYISSDDYKLDEVGAKLNIKFGSKIITLDLNVVG